MKNFLTVNIENEASNPEYKSFSKIYKISQKRSVRNWLFGILIILALVLIMPWTQHIRARGTVTTLRQEHRPQELNAVFPGRILKWKVKEGDFVQKGDTILQMGEVKIDYLDPNLLPRTQAQINAKKVSRQGYLEKSSLSQKQMEVLKSAQLLKLKSLDIKLLQQRSKVQSDSIDLQAMEGELKIYLRQIEAAKFMLDSGAISLTEFEKRKVSYQNGMAKKISIENKLAQSRQEILGIQVDKNSTIQDYTDKIFKAQGDKLAFFSAASVSEAEITKLENSYTNYNTRSHLFTILAPQSGQIMNAKKSGIGEIIKEGEMIAELIPQNIQQAVELFIDPVDIPLLDLGQKVRFVFDGFPAILFSGWPKNSYGTFGGKITAIENSKGANGKFRVLVAQDESDHKDWPTNLRLGGGAIGIALLKDVPIYYEIWRNINGFPPDYYKISETKRYIKKKK